MVDCPPLHGKVAAPHAVIILDPKELLREPHRPVHGMVVSSSIPRPGPEHIPLPNSQTHPACTTGFTKPCWAVSHWILRLSDRTRLGTRCGYVAGATLQRIILAHVHAVAAGHLPLPHPADF